MLHFCCRPSLLVGLALAACLDATYKAAPPDRDYETVTPAARPARAVPKATVNPPDPFHSSLVIADHPSAPLPRMRFVLRDGSVMVGQVLGFDGHMYALRLTHGTVLARKDLFVAVTPLPAATARR